MSDTRPWFVLSGLLFVLIGCPAGDDDDAADDDSAATDDDDFVPGDAEIYGTVTRDVSTCPPLYDGIGTLCVSAMSVCEDFDTEISANMIGTADMSSFETVVPFYLGGLPDGTWQLLAFLDDDQSGCILGVDRGDFALQQRCIEVEIVDQQDIEGLEIVFDDKSS